MKDILEVNLSEPNDKLFKLAENNNFKKLQDHYASTPKTDYKDALETWQELGAFDLHKCVIRDKRHAFEEDLKVTEVVTV